MWKSTFREVKWNYLPKFTWLLGGRTRLWMQVYLTPLPLLLPCTRRAPVSHDKHWCGIFAWKTELNKDNSSLNIHHLPSGLAASHPFPPSFSSQWFVPTRYSFLLLSCPLSKPLIHSPVFYYPFYYSKTKFITVLSTYAHNLKKINIFS